MTWILKVKSAFVFQTEFNLIKSKFVYYQEFILRIHIIKYLIHNKLNFEKRVEICRAFKIINLILDVQLLIFVLILIL